MIGKRWFCIPTVLLLTRINSCAALAIEMVLKVRTDRAIDISETVLLIRLADITPDDSPWNLLPHSVRNGTPFCAPMIAQSATAAAKP